MFLTQEHLIAGISADREQSVDTSSKESVWQNVAMFQDPENVLQDDSNPPTKLRFLSTR